MQINAAVNETRCLTKAFATNANTSSFTARTYTVTPPSGDGVLDFRNGGGTDCPPWLTVHPYGLGSDNDAFSIRLVGWRRIGSVGPPGSYGWVATTLCEMACTISQNCHGVAGSPILATEFFADTITIVSEPTITADTTRQGTVELFSKADDATLAYFRVKLCGVERLEFQFDQTTNTPTMNALYALHST